MLSFDQQIDKCVEILKKGGTLLYPTDTIWGIGCDATNPEAVEKIYKLKKRSENKSMIILLDKAEKIQDYVTVMPEIAWDLIDFAETPLTIIYPDARKLASNVIAEDHTIAIRVVKHDFCSRLIYRFGKPLVSTSANISGQTPPSSYNNIAREIIDGVDFAVDPTLGAQGNFRPSQIIKLEVNGEFRIIRK
ncbi:MAG: L-threonylcarbamoyladenylate synthase [Bacteroidota bacterium]